MCEPLRAAVRESTESRSAYIFTYQLFVWVGLSKRHYRDNINTALGKVLRGLFGSVTSDTTNLKLSRELRIAEDSIDDGASLVAGGSEDSDQVGHDEQSV